MRDWPTHLYGALLQADAKLLRLHIANLRFGWPDHTDQAIEKRAFPVGTTEMLLQKLSGLGTYICDFHKLLLLVGRPDGESHSLAQLFFTVRQKFPAVLTTLV